MINFICDRGSTSRTQEKELIEQEKLFVLVRKIVPTTMANTYEVFDTLI